MPSINTYGQVNVYEIRSFTSGTVELNELYLNDLVNNNMVVRSNYGIMDISASDIYLTGLTTEKSVSNISGVATYIAFNGQTAITGNTTIVGNTSLVGTLAITSSQLVTNLSANYVAQSNITSSDSTTYYPMFSDNGSVVSPKISTSRLSFVASSGVMSVPKLNVFNATDSTSSTTGDIVVAGGMGITKNIYIGAQIRTPQGVAGASNPSLCGDTDTDSGFYINASGLPRICSKGYIAMGFAPTNARTSKAIAYINSTITNNDITETSDGEALRVGHYYPQNAIGTHCDSTSSTWVLRVWNPNGNVGGIYVAGSTTFYATGSDERLKENITDSDEVLEKLGRIKIYDYKWKDKSGKDKGCLASELFDEYPDYVKKANPDDPKAFDLVSYTSFIPHLIKAVQELTDQNKKLMERVDKLEFANAI